MNNCKKCGNQINFNEKFCSNCGEPTNNQVVTNTTLQESRGVLNQNLNTSQIIPNLNNNGIQSNSNHNQNNKGKDKLPYIILIALVIILVGVISVLLILNNNSDKKSSTSNTNKNEYEENINDNKYKDDSDNITEDIDDTTTTTDNTNSITYKGFKFNKKTGYTYEILDDSLIISNNDYLNALTISKSSFSYLKSHLSELESEYKKNELQISNFQIKTFSNTDVIVSDVIIDNYKGTWYIIESKETGYIYQGYIINRSYTTNYNDVSIVLSLLENVEYIGNYSDYTSDINIKSLKKTIK